jgi:drug/metabolite transporter (DMT)-like permease
VKWLIGFSSLLWLPFVALAGVAIVAFTTAHGDLGRMGQACLAAAGAAFCFAVMSLAARAARNRRADDALARRAAWDAAADRDGATSEDSDSDRP